MTRRASLAIFLVVGLGVVAAVHYYVWLRLVHDPGLSAGLHRTLTIASVALFLSIPATLLSARRLQSPVGTALVTASFVWMGVLFILLGCVSAVDAVRLAGTAIQRLTGDSVEPDPERRRAAARVLAGLVVLVGGGASIAALRSGLGNVAVREVRVPLPHLAPELDGTTIVQLSDVHVGPTIGRAFVQRIVAQANALEPDIVAITGDLVDGSVRRLSKHVAPLSELRARHGVYFVTGNHEYYSGVEPWCRQLESLGVRVLRNERVEIGGSNDHFYLAGVDDFSAHRFGGDHRADLQRALAGRDPQRPVVLLAHQPRAIYEAERLGVALQLSGHTHGGQIWPWSYLVRLQQPVVSGLTRIGRAWIYVSNGTGYWGPPMRLGASAEITKLVLVRGS